MDKSNEILKTHEQSVKLSKKIQLYMRIMGVVIVIANTWLFSPLCSEANLGSWGVGLLFLLNPIAICVAGRSLGLKKHYITTLLFGICLILAVEFGGEFWKLILDRSGMEYTGKVKPSLGIIYDSILIFLFAMWVWLGRSMRKRMTYMVKQAIEQARIKAGMKELSGGSNTAGESPE